MNIIYKTKWALLELFPEQAATEKDAEEAARQKIIADAIAKAEEEAKAAAEAAQKAKEEAGEAAEEPSGEEQDTPVSAVDQAAAEMDAMELVPGKKADEAEDVPPEELPPPVSLLPEEGPRPNGVIAVDYAAKGVHIDVQCDPSQVVEAARILDEAGLFLESISGVDWIKEEQMEVIYDYNLHEGEFCRVVVRTRVPRSAPEVPTISDVHPGANWHERETHEFFGIKFQGHPYLVPLLLPEDADFHPLLKDFKP